MPEDDDRKHKYKRMPLMFGGCMECGLLRSSPLHHGEESPIIRELKKRIHRLFTWR